jgi:N-acetylmuramoyl-L-alanine amidase
MLTRRPERYSMPLRIIIPVLLACLLLWPLPAAFAASLSKGDIVKQYQQATAFYNNLTHTERGGQRERWLVGVNSFQRIYRSHPTHELAPSCLFMLGRIYHDMGRHFDNSPDLGEAIAYFQDVALLFPEHLLADDALYRVAEIYLYDRKAPDEAAKIFARIISAYPNGDMAAPAGIELERLKKMAGGPATPPDPPLAHLPLLPQTVERKTSARQGLTQIKPVRHWSNADYTRVVIETGAPVNYSHSVLPEDGNRPRRLYVDLQSCRLPPGMENSVPVGDGLLKQVRTGQFSRDTVRVVLDIESIADYKIFNLQEPFRVVIDALGKPQPGPKMASASPNPILAPSLPQQLGLGIRRIVLDPGHGGKDPGAIGPGGVKEKEVVLRVAKKLARHLERELGCEIIFTRDRDIFVPLEERTAIANTSGADLFISIHANAAPSPEVRGVETYFLDFATNKDAMRVAARENATSTHQLSDLQSILLDLMRNTKINESAKLAGFVQSNMISGLRQSFSQVNDLGVKRAPFVVLIGAQMPAVLVEIAFLSNPEEARRLTEASYLEELSLHIAAGVSRYATDLNLANLKLD